MRIHIKIEGRVTGPGRSDYFYAYHCEKFEKIYIHTDKQKIPHYYTGSSFIPYFLYFNLVQEIDIDKKSIANYLSILAKHLNDNYQKKMPALNKNMNALTNDAFNNIDDLIRKTLAAMKIQSFVREKSFFKKRSKSPIFMEPQISIHMSDPERLRYNMHDDEDPLSILWSTP